jgi:hypothetical protein
MDWMAKEMGVCFLAEARYFTLLHSVQTGTGAHTASVLIDPNCWGVKLPAHLYLMLRSGIYGSILPLPLMPSWLSVQLIKHKN